MKIIGISDPHGTSRATKNRISDPQMDFKNKMKYIFEYASNINAIVVCSGDLFNTPRDYSILFEFLSITNQYPNVKFFTVFGQHDMFMRNKEVLNNLSILSKAKVITLLSRIPVKLKKVHLYGCNWGDAFPKPKHSKNIVNILSIHASITEKQLFPNQKFHRVKSWLKKYGLFDFIILGDIHVAFSKNFTMPNSNTGTIINTGPIMRLEANEYNKTHEPHFYVWDSTTRESKKVYIPVLPVDRVLNFEKTIKEEDNGIVDLSINTSKLSEMNILSILKSLLSRLDNSDGVRTVLNKVIEEVDHKTDFI
jgi:hypothetical protein